MGIIKKQGINYSIISFIGIILGVFNILIIYPKVLQPEELGLVRFIIDSGIFLSPFLLLGVHSVALKYFPEFKNPLKAHNGFLSFLLLYFFGGLLFFCLLFWFFKDRVYAYVASNPELYQSYVGYILSIAFSYSLFSLLMNYVANFKKIVIPNVFAELIKITLPILALLYFGSIISLDFLIKGIVLHYFLIAIGVGIYIKYLKEWSFKFDKTFISKDLLKRIFTFSRYSILGSIGSVMANRIDILMVASLINFKNTGIYTIALTIASVINTPNNAIGNIASPLIAQAWKENDVAQIQDIYQKGSINLLAFGFLIFALIYFSLDDLFQIMPNGEVYKAGKSVVIILALAKLVDMATSVNSHIILFSKYYKFNTFALILLSVLNIIFNYVLIPIFFIKGAALATLASVTLFNLIKLIFIKVKFDLMPFTKNTIKLVLILCTILALFTVFPSFSNPFINIILKSTCISLVYLSCLVYFNAAPEITDMVKKNLQAVFKGS